MKNGHFLCYRRFGGNQRLQQLLQRGCGHYVRLLTVALLSETVFTSLFHPSILCQDLRVCTLQTLPVSDPLHTFQPGQDLRRMHGCGKFSVVFHTDFYSSLRCDVARIWKKYLSFSFTFFSHSFAIWPVHYAPSNHTMPSAVFWQELRTRNNLLLQTFRFWIIYTMIQLSRMHCGAFGPLARSKLYQWPCSRYEEF